MSDHHLRNVPMRSPGQKFKGFRGTKDIELSKPRIVRPFRIAKPKVDPERAAILQAHAKRPRKFVGASCPTCGSKHF